MEKKSTEKPKPFQHVKNESLGKEIVKVIGETLITVGVPLVTSIFLGKKGKR